MREEQARKSKGQLRSNVLLLNGNANYNLLNGQAHNLGAPFSGSLQERHLDFAGHARRDASRLIYAPNSGHSNGKKVYEQPGTLGATIPYQPDTNAALF